MRASLISWAMRALRYTMPSAHLLSPSAVLSVTGAADKASAWSILASSTWLSKGLVR